VPRAYPALEQLEVRDVPAGLFLQGQVYFDNNANGQLDPGETPQAGATVELYAASDLNTPLATQTVGADGVYQFTDLAAGDYRLVQTPPSGFVNSWADADRCVLGGTTAIQPKIIDVTLSAGPYHLALVGDDLSNNPFTEGRLPGTYVPVVTTLTNFPNMFGSFTQFWNYAGEFNVALSGGELSDPNTFISFCLDLGHELALSADVTPLPDYFNLPSTLTFPGVAQSGRIAYLYNRYHEGFSGSGADVKAAALQIALWELAYDEVPSSDPTAAQYLQNGNHKFDWAAPGAPDGNFSNDTTLTAAIRTQAYAYLLESVGKNELAIFLDGPSEASQLMIARGSLDFGNVTESTISGMKFHDINGDGEQDAESDVVLEGFLIELYRDGGNGVFDGGEGDDGDD
jgi:hypothetical protein